MKNNIFFVVLVIAMLLVCSGCTAAGENAPDVTESTEVTAPSTPEPGDHIEATGTISLDMNPWTTIKALYDAQGNHCRVVQGSCTDGTYLYVALNDGRNNTTESVSAIRKYELSSGKLVATYENLNVSHCNDMTYNAETDELIIAHCMPERNVISIFDIHTMKLKEKKTLKLQIDSLSYDPHEKCYWVSTAYGYNFAKLDLNFQKIGKTYIGRGGYVKQGMDVDSRYIYFLHYDKNIIQVFTKDGQYVRQIQLPVTEQETESICHVGDVFYISYYTFPEGGKIYRTVFEN